MEINLPDNTEKLQSLQNINTDVKIRTTALSMIVNVLNAFIQSHPLTEQEMSNIQAAVNAEYNYITQLTDLLMKNIKVMTFKEDLRTKSVSNSPTATNINSNDSIKTGDD